MKGEKKLVGWNTGSIRSRAVCGIVLIVLLALETDFAWAQKYDRLTLIEEFTSATCVPCLGADSILAGQVFLGNGVVSIRYHMNDPEPGDPFYLANPTDADVRYTYYGINDIPMACVDGKGRDPQNAGLIRTSINESHARKSPVGIDVSIADGNTVVTIKSDIDLKKHVLHIVQVNRKVVLLSLPYDLEWSNDATEFEDAMMAMLPGPGGTLLNVSSGSEQTFDIQMKSSTGQLWPDGQMYVVAFIQDMDTKEVIQAGTCLNELSVAPRYTGPTYNRIATSGEISRTVTITNRMDEAVEVSLDIDNKDDMITKGWRFPDPVMMVNVPARGSTDVTLNAVAPAVPHFATLDILCTPTDTIAPHRTTKARTYYMVEGGRMLMYYKKGAFSFINAETLERSHVSNLCVSMPFDHDLIEAYPPADFDAIGYALDYFTDPELSSVFDDVSILMQQGKSIWLTSEVGYGLLRSESGPVSPVKSFLDDSIGLIHKWRINRIETDDQGYVTGTLLFPVTGVKDDPISDGIQFEGNMYDQTSWPFYQISTDVFQIKSTSRAQPVLKYDHESTSMGCIRWESTSGARVVFSTLGLEAIADPTIRMKLARNTVGWLLGLSNKYSDISVSDTSIFFGYVPMPGESTRTLTIDNPGDAPLTVHALALEGRDAESFVVPTGSAVIGSHEARLVEIRFKPKSKGNHTARLNVLNDASKPISVELTGVGSGGSTAVDDIIPGRPTLHVSTTSDASSCKVIIDNCECTYQPFTIDVVSLSGQILLHHSFASFGVSAELELPLTSLSSGMYSVVFTGGGYTAMQPLIVVR